MTVYPNYYPHFSCIADKCRHNCCIGWEIDIDEDTLAYYGMLEGEMGARLSHSIRREDGYGCFILDDEERCPFLNEKGLCEIILRLGEDALPDICTDHPRFRHFFATRTELGLGLSCESAAHLILGMREKMTLLEEHGTDSDTSAPSDASEEAFLLRRDQLLSIAQKRSLSLDERMQTLINDLSADPPSKSYAEWASFYRSLERMDDAFERVLDRIASLSPQEDVSATDEILFEQLLVYFLYRHYTPENDCASVGFAVHATRLLRALASSDALSFSETAELCRLYSAEIEYSEENTDALMALFAPNEEE